MALNFEILDTYETWATEKAFTAAVTDIITSTTHGLVDNDIIRVRLATGSALPAPLVGDTIYYVKWIDANTFYLALTPGGATINITSTGTGTFYFNRSTDFKLFTAGTNDIITCTGHGFVDDDVILVDSNSALPSPLVSNTKYYVKYIDVNTFYLALTAGGDTIDITNTGSGTHRLSRLLGSQPLRNGELITNLTRAGSAIITYTSRASFGTSNVISLEFLVISGSFVALDECSTAEGGSFAIYGSATTVTDDTIIVDGIDDSDSTADLAGAISADVTTIYDTDYSVVPNLRYIKIDDEWMFILDSGNGSNSKTFTAATTDICTRTAHGLSNSQVVRLTTTGSLPGGLATGTSYYVKYLSANTFYLSLTLDGATVDITSTGSGTHTFTLQDPLIVKRAMFGSTAAVHADNASIYILAEDLPRAIIDEDIAQGWGLCSMASGKFEINAPIMYGRPDQTGQSILLTVLDRVECDELYVVGDITYGTIFQSGVGWADDGDGVYTGFYFNGANISAINFSQFAGSCLNLFGGTLYLSDANGNILLGGQTNIMIANISSVYYNNFIQFSNKESCKIYRSWINNQRVSASSESLDWNGVYINYKIYQESYYFLSSGGDATFKNMEMVDSQFDAGGFGFAASGTKTFIDCIVNKTFGLFLAGVDTVHQNSVNMTTVNPSNTDFPNINVRIFDKDGNEVVNGTSDVSGVIEEQIVTVATNDGTGITYKSPFLFFVNLPGTKEKYFAETIDEPKIYKFTIEDDELSEDIRYI